MNNAKQPPYVPVPQELFGGLYTEAAPESLPTGASPRCINCDFIVGQVNPRPGKESVYYYSGFFEEDQAGHGQSVADAGSSGEAAWIDPSNITLDTPGTDAVVTLNFAGPGTGAYSFDKAVGGTNAGSPTNFSTGPASAQLPFEWAFFVITHGNTITMDPGWTELDGGTTGFTYGQLLTGGSISANGTFGAGGSSYASSLALFYTQNNQAPTIQNGNTATSGFVFNIFPRTISSAWSNPNTPGNCIIVSLLLLGQTGGGTTITDDSGNTYYHLTTVDQGGSREVQIWIAENIIGGSNQVHVTNTLGFASSGDIVFTEFSPLGNPSATGPKSQQLQGLNYGFAIPDTVGVLGFQILMSGNQTDATATSGLEVTVANGTADTPVIFTQLPASNGTVTVGEPTENWGLALTPALLNDPNFTVQAQAVAPDGTQTTFSVYSLAVKVWLTPNPAPNFNYLKTFSETGGEILTLALSSAGVMFQEDVVNAPGVLTAVDAFIEPDSYAQSATVDDREFIAISNLMNGTDIPLTYTPPNFDRLSQVGPGAAPGASATSAGSNVVSINQQPKFELPPLSGTQKTYIQVSVSASDTGTFGTPDTPGNVCAVWIRENINLPTYSLGGKTYPVFQVGTNIVLTGWPEINGNAINNDPAGVTAPAYYTLTAVGAPIPGQDYYVGFVFTVNFTTFFNNHDTPVGPGLFIQSTLATMTTGAQVPNLEVGSQFQLAGTGGAPPAGYDSNWTVSATPNASQLQITATRLNGNVAQYSYNLISGAAPAVGQAVTVTQTLNGNGVFNVSNAIISATGAGTFSINLNGPNITSSAESGSGIIFGTLFQFDAFAIVGNKTGGTIVTTGVIGEGIRKVCYSYLTRNGYITQPSPILTFDVTSGAASIAISNLLPGPPNVIARIIHLTAANGGNFYNIPQPVTVNNNGTNVINSSTWVNDNTSTSAILSFSDAVLLAGDQIDIEGNNLFECAELGSCVALVPYSNRLFAVGEQNKLTNFLNWSFDGGIQTLQQTAGGSQSVNQLYPAGWTVDPTSGAGGSVVDSSIFGFAYQILNNTGSTQAAYGMITQNAFEDEFLVPIIEASTTYSVRVTAAVPTGAASGNLVVDLYSPKFGRALGSFSLALNSMTSSMLIYTGTLLTTALAPVPNDLLLRIWAQNIPNGVQINVDRSEVFPTEEPNLNQQVTGSYTNNFESFDQVTGVILGTNINQQPIVSAFVLFDTLYLVKTGSLISVSDNNTTEPNNWNVPRTISAAVGGAGPYAVTTGIDAPNSGEEWSVIAGRSGAYIFNGGQPTKLTEEIQKVWNQINWAYGYTIWIQNDITNRRILIGVPLKEKDARGNSPVWLPAGIIANGTNPTSPNVILELNYKQIDTAGALAGSPEVHKSYSGKLIASEIVRKWSLWTITAPCAAFITRPDNTAPIFLGNSSHTGKIYDLVEGLLEDDGSAILQDYITSAFVPTETGQGTQMGVTRYNYDYMTMDVTGVGDLSITTQPNSIDGPYANQLLPDLTLPASTNGDVEIPLNECATRLYLEFEANTVGAGFTMARLVVVMHQDPWSPVRGVNN